MFEVVVSLRFPPSYRRESVREFIRSDLCGGEVKYLHRSLASRRRRQKGKSQI
jgi:hypothetical protein